MASPDTVRPSSMSMGTLFIICEWVLISLEPEDPHDDAAHELGSAKPTVTFFGFDVASELDQFTFGESLDDVLFAIAKKNLQKTQKKVLNGTA